MHEAVDRVIDHYERHALAWDADRHGGGWPDKPWHDRFIAALPSGAHVLDLGCGSGFPVARQMVDCGLRVVGVDSSATLISLARQSLPHQQWLVADMRSLRVDRRFEGVLAWDSFFHLEPDDQRMMFEVFVRHAAPPAVLMFNSGPAHGEAIGEYRGDPLYHASLDAQEYRVLLDRAGFKLVDHVVEDWQNAGGRTVWLAHRRDEPPEL